MNGAWAVILAVNWHRYPRSVYPYVRWSADFAAIGIPQHWKWSDEAIETMRASNREITPKHVSLVLVGLFSLIGALICYGLALQAAWPHLPKWGIIAGANFIAAQMMIAVGNFCYKEDERDARQNK